MKINLKFIVTKRQVHFQPMHSSCRSNTEDTWLKCTVFLWVDNVHKKYKTSSTSFLGLFASTVSMRSYYDLFKIIRQCCLPSNTSSALRPFGSKMLTPDWLT